MPLFFFDHLFALEKVAILRVLLSSLVRKQDIDDNLGALRAEHAHLLLLSANTNFSRSLIKNSEFFLFFPLEPLFLSSLNHAAYLFIFTSFPRQRRIILLSLLLQFLGHLLFLCMYATI